MARFLSYVVLVALVTAGAVWLADRPGTVAAEWLGWHVETSVPVLLLALLVLATSLFLVLRGLVGLWRWPAAMGHKRRESRKRDGYQALSDGLAAAIGGEAPKARKLAGRADKLLGDPALTTFLSAQAAKLSGDKAAARQYFTLMLERAETASLGLKGLLEQALEAEDDAQALDLATRALAASPGDSWLADIAFKLNVKAARLDRAQDIVASSQRNKAFTKTGAARRRALLDQARAAQAQQAGDDGQAARLAKRALGADPDLFSAAIILARSQAQAGNERRAAATLERAWKQFPTPELAAAYAALRPHEDSLSRLRRLEKLVAGNATGAVAHHVLGEAALDAKLWGQARKHLLAAVAVQPTAGAYTLLARLERAEYADIAAAQKWADLAAQSPADPTWVCTSCAGTSPQWALSCRHCGAVDSLAWGRPKGAALAVSGA